MRLWYRFCRLWCRLYFCTLHFGRVLDRHHVPPTGPVLLVSNHQSFFDPVLVGYGLNREVDYMARESLFRNPVFTHLIRSLNAFPVKRGEVDIGAVKETLRRLKAGRAVLLFPEATRTSDGKIREFKTGLAMLAGKTKAPVVPVVIDGAYEAWPRTGLLPRPMTAINVLFGTPYQTDELTRHSPEEFVKLIHRQMIQMQDHLRRIAARPPLAYHGLDNENNSC